MTAKDVLDLICRGYELSKVTVFGGQSKYLLQNPQTFDEIPVPNQTVEGLLDANKLVAHLVGSSAFYTVKKD